MSQINGLGGSPMADAAKGIAEEMKDIRKLKMSREAMVDPSKVGKLIQMQANPIYNASGNIIQTAGKL
ncbi:hypothetical protein [Desulfohalovibrio reitneri]|uniref:hypothetical protein n=1 Tax=Desulfohalovibrio reitneri TaxID=1307759 RepID=UPI0004A72A49|nr:hypothetical protein [Desulfohalovibrio reitneri]